MINKDNIDKLMLKYIRSGRDVLTSGEHDMLLNDNPHGEFRVGYRLPDTWVNKIMKYVTQGISENTRIYRDGRFVERPRWKVAPSSIYANSLVTPCDGVIYTDPEHPEHKARLYAHNINISISFDALNDASFDVYNEYIIAMSAAISAELDYGMWDGDGRRKPYGINRDSRILRIDIGIHPDIILSELQILTKKIPGDYLDNAKWYMKESLGHYLGNLMNPDGTYVVNPEDTRDPDVDYKPNTLLGYPVCYNDWMPYLAYHVEPVIMFGSLIDGHQIAFRPKMDVVSTVDPEFIQTHINTICYISNQIIDTRAIVIAMAQLGR